MLNEGTALRVPSPSKRGMNGFTETPVDASRVLLLPTGDKGDDGDDEVIAVSDEALHRYRQAMYILTQKDRPMPTLAQMTEEIREAEDSARLDVRIKRLKQQHLDDLQRLYFAHAEEYHEEVLHRHNSKDETQYLSSGENNTAVIASYERLGRLYRDVRDAASYEIHWHDDIAHMNYAYQQENLHLRGKRKALRAREEEIRKREDAQFPRDITDWRTKSRDVRLRVARFLDGDSARQDRMMTEFGWAWRQTLSLKEEYSKSEEFQDEVRDLLSVHEVKDPRAKRYVI